MSSLATDFQRAIDPTSVFRDGARDASGNPIEPAQWQSHVMESEARRQLILCNRQAGKSTTIGAKCARGMIYAPGLYLIIAPTLRQSKLLFRKVREIIGRLPDAPGLSRDTGAELELDNGSSLVALPGDNDANIRGYSAPRAVYIDEAARVIDSVYAAVRPMLAASDDSQLIALSTPYGRRGWFYEAWEFQKGWGQIKITAHDCAHITPEFLEEEREGMSEWQFRSEYLCEFTDTEESFFSSDLIDAMVDNTLEAWA